MANQIAITDVTAGTFIQRDMTDEELAQDKINREMAKKDAEEALAKEAEKIQAREAILAKIGLTAEEARALLG